MSRLPFVFQLCVDYISWVYAAGSGFRTPFLSPLGRCWSPNSIVQTRAAAALLGDLLVYLPADEERMQQALAAVVEALEKAVARTTVPPWPSAVTAVCRLAEVSLLYTEAK